MSDDTDHTADCGCRGGQAAGEPAAKGSAGEPAATSAAVTSAAVTGSAGEPAATGAAAGGPCAGLAASRRFVVDRERTIDFMGEQARVYATPMLVRDVELTCRDLLLAHVQPGQDSVGTRVELDHLAATLLGMEVALEVTVTEVKGRSVTFAVQGRDPLEAICRGTHVRFVVDRAVTEARLAAKAAKAAKAAETATG